MPAVSKKVDLEKAAKAVEARDTKLGPWIQVRVIAKAQYGYPYARLVEPGEQIKLYLKDCYQEPREGNNEMTGLPWRSIEVKGKTYGLPSWAMDVNDPYEEEDTQEQLLAAVSGRPMASRRGPDEDAEDVL